MDSEQIYQRVMESADRFGPGNSQEFKLLGSQLSQCRPRDVFTGLLLVFSRSNVGESNFRHQELAGRLLEKMKPSYKFELGPALRSVIDAYDPSIEQLLIHFVRVHGKEAVLHELSQIETEPITERSQAVVKTMQWWLTGKKE